MPAGKRTQSNAMLYTLITFVGFTLVFAITALIYYMKFEEQRTVAQSANAELAEFAKPAEISKIGAIVGDKKANESYLGKMTEYLDFI
jgi:hypothetical protein